MSHGERVSGAHRGQWTRNGFSIPARGLGDIAAPPTGAHTPNPANGRTRRPGLDVTCWCESEVVRVTLDDVRNGRTGSCGRVGCGP